MKKGDKMQFISSDPDDYSVLELIKSDFVRYLYPGKALDPEDVAKVSVLRMILYALFALNQSFTYSFYLRIAYKKVFILGLFSRIKLIRLSRLYGLQIPYITKIGPGFYIGHGVGIVVNGGTIIGKSVNISQFLTIGTSKSTPAIIGDYVYIGPGVCVVEDVKIGSFSKIGAGAVIINDVPVGATSVGNPNRNISKG